MLLRNIEHFRNIRIDKPAPLRVVIPRLKIIQPRLRIVVIPTVRAGVQLLERRVARHGHDLAVCVVHIGYLLRSRFVNDSEHVALRISPKV